MKDYMGQYVGLLEKWDDGKYHVPWSPSPEWQDNLAAAWGQDDSGNLALIRWLGGALLDAEKVLGIRSRESVQWRDILANLAPFHQDDTGLMIMKDKPFNASHRHFSHLLALYPLGVIHAEGTDADRQLIDRSLGNIVYRGMGAWCGYSVAWMAAAMAIDEFMPLGQGRMKRKLMAAATALEGGVRRVILATANREQPGSAPLAGRGTVIG